MDFVNVESTSSSRGPQGADELVVPIRNLADVVEACTSAAPTLAAADYFGVTLTYASLDRWSNRLANVLRSRGVQQYDVIGLHLPNTPQYLIGMVAAARLGCPVTGISPLLSAAEAHYQINDAGVRYLLSLDQFYSEKVQPLDGQCSRLRGVLVTGALDFLPQWKRLLAYALKKVPRVRWQPLTTVRTEALMPVLRNAATDRIYTSFTEEDTAYIQYTGGTTGLPKGAELSLRNVNANVAQLRSFLPDIEGKALASAFPIFHAAGLGTALVALHGKVRQCLIPNPRDMAHFIAQIKKRSPAMMANVPLLYQKLMEQPDFRKVDFSQLEMAFSGAAPFSPDAIRQLEQIIGHGKLCEGYGMTEATTFIALNPIGRAKIGTVGLPMPNCELRIVDIETGMHDMPPGEPGEIILSGPQVMKGYRNRPGETAKAIRVQDGRRWLFTGDVGFLDTEGYLTICDRVKDMLIVGGFKVFSLEVESKLRQLPCIDSSALIGMPDPHRPGNDIIQLFVQLSAQAKGTDLQRWREEITYFCRQNLAPYKIPADIEFLDALPLTSLGKIDKKALRRMSDVKYATLSQTNE